MLHLGGAGLGGGMTENPFDDLGELVWYSSEATFVGTREDLISAVALVMGRLPSPRPPLPWMLDGSTSFQLFLQVPAPERHDLIGPLNLSFWLSSGRGLVTLSSSTSKYRTEVLFQQLVDQLSRVLVRRF